MELSGSRNEFAIATALLGSPPEAVLPAFGSESNRVFRVCAAPRDYALKQYSGSAETASHLVQRTAEACRFLAAGPLGDFVPQLTAVDTAGGAALFEWVAGAVPAQRQFGELAQLERFLGGLLSVSRGPSAAAFPAAVGACKRPADLVGHVEACREQLQPQERIPRLARILALFDAFWPSARSGLLLPQDPARLVLSPVDFGFHKALRRPDGRLVFFGFSRFGWDDPARLVADLLWNPAMALSPLECASLAATAQSVFGAGDGGFPQRLSRIRPAIGLSWALRLLNKARSGRQQARNKFLQDNASVRQIENAEICVRRVEESLHELAA